jgi:bacterioferritin-associated ferredoxin
MYVPIPVGRGSIAEYYVKRTVLTIIRIRVHNSVMIVCVCKAVSERHIRAAVNDGASCMRDITRELRVGTCCGKCLPEAKAALSACLAQRNDAGPSSFFPGTATEFAV